MQTLRQPQWLFLVNTLPMLVLLAVGSGEFSVIHTLLPASSLNLWQVFGMIISLLALGTAGYAGWHWQRGRLLHPWYSAVALLTYSLVLCLLLVSDDHLLPFGTVPGWMVPTDPVLMAWTFGMPTLAHALLALVAYFTPDDRPQQAVPNLLLALGIPFGCLLVSGMLSVLPWHLLGSGVGLVVWVAGAVVATLGFFFFLVRGVYIVAQRSAAFWSRTALLWKILVSLVLPITGLLVNGGLFLGWGSGGGIFGNFSNPWFYGLAVLNGALLCVPNPAQPAGRLALLAARSALFGYTLYFFLVFLPFLPLAIPGILLIGLGFLVLAPVLLLVLHVRQLSDDVAALHLAYSPGTVRGVLLAGLLVLPLAITGSYWHRRQTLHEALSYVYTPNYAQPGRVDAAALAGTLAAIREHKAPRQEWLSGNLQPYLSEYFNWLVLDNLMLSDAKLDNLDRIFGSGVAPMAEILHWQAAESRPATGTRLSNVQASSTYDAQQQAWVSWVNLAIGNSDPNIPDGEYRSRFALPPGCWVSDYYLTIGQRQERGILAEQKAATWVFAQIVNEHQRRDPGLLAYTGPDEVTLRVYPVAPGILRYTRIQLLHKEPCTLTIDGQEVPLGTPDGAPPVTAPVLAPGQGVAYVSALAKQQLPLVQRRPYYHFLLDASAAAGHNPPDYAARVARQLARPLPYGAPPRFSLVDAYTTPVPAGTDWAAALRQAPHTGGCYLGGAIRRVLFEAGQHPTDTYPIIVVATDYLRNAALDEDFADLRSAYPETDLFYVLDDAGRLEPHSLRQQSRQVLDSDADAVPAVTTLVRAWPSAAQPRAYLPNTNAADIVLTQPQAVPTAGTAGATNRWLAGLLLQGYQQWQSFHPETTDRERVPFIQASFRAGILTPATAYLALENEAQKAALQRKQAETLAANASLDTMEKEQEDPPVGTPIDGDVGLLVLAGALLAGWQLRQRR